MCVKAQPRESSLRHQAGSIQRTSLSGKPPSSGRGRRDQERAVGAMLTAGHERQGGATGKERGRPEKLQRQGDGVSPGDSREPADTLLPPVHPFVMPASRAGR